MVSGAFVDLNDEQVRKQVIAVKSNIENLKVIDNNLRTSLYASAIISENDDDNINSLFFFSLCQRFNSKTRCLILLPTMNCNLSCTYCYEGENKNSSRMDADVISRIKQYIKKEYMGNVDEIKLQWYGGEPLMEFNTIEDITAYIDSLGIKYSSSIITNGTLLDEHKIEKLKSLNIESIQITLDGIKKNHDKRRIFKNGNGTFDLIYANMNVLHKYISSTKSKINVSIRINIDKDNYSDYHKIRAKINKDYPLFHVYPGILMHYKTCTCGIPCFDNKEEVAKFYITEYEKYGITDLPFYPSSKSTGSCMAESPYTDMIGPRGEMYLCLKDAGDSEETIGNIYEGRNKIKMIAAYSTGQLTFNSLKCNQCNMLALCGGGCANINYRNKKYGENNDPCVPFKKEEFLKKFLDIYYSIKKNHEKNNTTCPSSATVGI